MALANRFNSNGVPPDFRYILAFGSNLGDKKANADTALKMLSLHGQLLRLSPRVMTHPLISDVFETSDHEPFLNFVAEYRLRLRPHDLYRAIVRIEDFLGHERQRRWAPRSMDIDILLAAHDDHPDFRLATPIILDEPEPGLCIPHRDFYNRDFWQALLLELR